MIGWCIALIAATSAPLAFKRGLSFAAARRLKIDGHQRRLVMPSPPPSLAGWR
jgi:hypothetical protein